MTELILRGVCALGKKLPVDLLEVPWNMWCSLFCLAVRAIVKQDEGDMELTRHACRLAMKVDTGTWTLETLIDLQMLCRYFMQKGGSDAALLRRISCCFLEPAVAHVIARS